MGYTIEDAVLRWGPWKELWVRNVALGSRGGAARPNSGEAGGAPGRAGCVEKGELN
jgi:hypothetical protein